MEDDDPVLSIGELARRTGLPVRTIRFWSDIGVVPPAARTGSGRRLYDAACVARLELVATLRDLGLSLADVRRVLAGQASIAEVAAVHLDALDAQIRALRLHRAVLAVVVKRAAGNEEMTLMSKLAQMSVAERRQMIPAARRHTRPIGHKLRSRSTSTKGSSPPATCHTAHPAPADPLNGHVDSSLRLVGNVLICR